MKKYKFQAEIKKHIDKDATYIEIPFDVEQEFDAKRVKVKAKFEDVEYRGSIVKMGLPCYIIGITKEVRNKINKTYGQIISVEIEKDEEERTVEIPKEFTEKLTKSKKANDFFKSLSYSQKRKYINWITTAKRDETKNKRIEEAIINLEEKNKI